MRLMRVELKRLDAMDPAPYNPRVELQPGDPEWMKIEATLEEFGMVELLVWNERTGHVVGGHQRRNVLLHHGIEEALCVVVDFDLEKEQACNVALNRVAGRWDERKLAELLAGLDEDLLLPAGYTTAELDELAKRVEAGEVSEAKPDPTIAPAAGEIAPEVPISPELHEAHNYVVLYFDNSVDWETAKAVLGLGPVKTADSTPTYMRKGIGRVVPGKDVIARLLAAERKA